MSVISPSPLRVCLITGFRPTPGGGGMEKHVYELARGLLDRGLKVDVICEDRSFLPDEDDRLQGHILGVDPDSLSAEGWVARYAEKSRRFAELLQPARYDLVHAHSHYGFHAALKLARARVHPPLVTTFHLTPLGSLERFAQLGFPEPEGAPIDRAVALMEEASAQLSQRCIAVSGGVAREVIELYGVPPQGVEVIHNWFDPRLFYPRDQIAARRQLGLDPDGRYLLYVGHFELQRGLLMAEAMRRLPDDITLIAVHPQRDAHIAAEFGDRIQFAGYVPPPQLALYYAAADLQCFPTVYGAFGLVLIEGMACGCPPVVFDYSAMNELVTPECGYLVAEPTAEAYARAIQQALSERGAKREAAVRRSRLFHMDPQIDKVLALYQRMVGDEGAGQVETVAQGALAGQ